MAVGGLDGGIFRKRHDAAHATRLRIQQTRATTSSLGTVAIVAPLDSSQGRGNRAHTARKQRASTVTNRRTSRAFYSQRGFLNLIESLDVTATMAVTQTDQTSTITATHVANPTGSIAVTQTNQTSTITATHTPPPVTATLTGTQTAQTSTITADSAAAYENVTGTIAVVQGDQRCDIHAQRFGGVSQDRIEPGPVFPGRTRRRYFNASKNPVTGP